MHAKVCAHTARTDEITFDEPGLLGGDLEDTPLEETDHFPTANQYAGGDDDFFFDYENETNAVSANVRCYGICCQHHEYHTLYIFVFDLVWIWCCFGLDKQDSHLLLQHLNREIMNLVLDDEEEEEEVHRLHTYFDFALFHMRQVQARARTLHTPKDSTRPHSIAQIPSHRRTDTTSPVNVSGANIWSSPAVSAVVVSCLCGQRAECALL